MTDGRIHREDPCPHSPTGQSSHVSRSETGGIRIWYTRNAYYKKRIQRQGFESRIKWENDGRRDAGSEKKGRGQAMVWNGSRGRSQTRKTLRPHHPDGDQSFSVDYNPRLARVVSIPSRRILGVTTTRRTIATRRFPLPPSIEQTGVSSGGSAARKRASPVRSIIVLDNWPRDGRRGNART